MKNSEFSTEKQYTIEKKAGALIMHQGCLIMLITNTFSLGYLSRLYGRDFDGAIFYSVLAMFGLIGSFVALAFMMNYCGQRYMGDKKIYLLAIDKIPGDILILIFFAVVAAFMMLLGDVKRMQFEIEGLLITVGSIAYVLDLAIILVYLSIVRRVKADCFKESCLYYKAYTWLIEFINTKKRPLSKKAKERERLTNALKKMASGDLNMVLNPEEFTGEERELCQSVNHIRDGMMTEIARRVKDEQMKADLVTNVSHDIKTPLTSIINYVELLERENIDNENARKYIRIIEEKSKRLKDLTEDLVEVSKISSGNIALDIRPINFVELLYQTGGEFNERFEAENLTIVTKVSERNLIIRADGRQLYRTLENLYINASKYALKNSNVYVSVWREEDDCVFSIKNMCRDKIDIGKSSVLTERFVRGDESRSTTGSGLGLSITKSLTSLMGGSFTVDVDGDIFVATIRYPLADKQ